MREGRRQGDGRDRGAEGTRGGAVGVLRARLRRRLCGHWDVTGGEGRVAESHASVLAVKGSRPPRIWQSTQSPLIITRRRESPARSQS